jgi:ketosteroid isomerase-like protein
VEATTEREIRDLVARWDEAMVRNDADAIGAFMAEDWVIVGSDGSVDGKERFLALVASGELSHDVMTTRDMQVRVYGQTAVTVARGTSGGRFRGTPFLLTERASCVFVNDHGRWVCVLTHLSSLSDPPA